MKARKSTMLNRTEFEITAFDFETSQYQALGRLVSNFDRSRYSLYFDEHRTGRKRILATYSITYKINSNKNLAIYYPRLNDRNEPTIFYEDSTGLDLQFVFR